MPKRSEREMFDESIFEENPFKDDKPTAIYRKLKWGNEPSKLFPIDAPEPLVCLGEVAQLIDDKKRVKKYREGYGPFLAIGAHSNLVWFIPQQKGHPLKRIPKTGYVRVAKVRQTDYLSDKGGEDAYYYHKHERPYPTLWIHEKSGCMVLEPARFKGRRSYAVAVEGIVG